MPRASRLVTVAAALPALGAAFLLATLPPPAIPAPSNPGSGPVRSRFLPGAFHVHTNRSDGTGTVDEVAAAAARAGLTFVVFTDHGDGTRPPEPPAYRHGVLCIDGVEISTNGGHYIGVGLPRTPYPLGGDPADVVADVARFGGFGIVAHPDSPKPSLKWTDWSQPVDGFEWLNADSEWRDEPFLRLARGLFDYLFRPAETLASLIDRPASTLQRWETLTNGRPVVAIAGADAHARLGLRSGTDPFDSVVLLRFPGYEISFRAFSVRVGTSQPLSGVPASDAAAILDSIRHGRLYSTLDGLATPGPFEFVAESSGTLIEMGGRIAYPSGPVALTSRVSGPPGTILALFHDGKAIQRTATGELQFNAPATPATYRIEARLANAPGTPLPWILSNPIYVGPASMHAPERAAAPALETRPLQGPDVRNWTVERDDTSTGNLQPLGQAGFAFQFHLGPDRARAPYAAIRRRLDADTQRFTRISFSARSDAPRRVSVQLRSPGEPDGRRWRKSVAIDATERDYTILIADLRPSDPADLRSPDRTQVDTLLVVLDTVHTLPGSEGSVWIRDLRLEW